MTGRIRFGWYEPVVGWWALFSFQTLDTCQSGKREEANGAIPRMFTSGFPNVLVFI
jgi:hypothetical protein